MNQGGYAKLTGKLDKLDELLVRQTNYIVVSTVGNWVNPLPW